MPTFRPLDREEVNVLGTPRKVDIRPYVEWLKGLKTGEGGEVLLDPKENRRVVMRRLRMAAKHLNMSIRFRGVTNAQQIIFEIFSEEDLA